MNTLDVMCIEFTRQRPSRISLSRTAASTSDVILTKSIRLGTFSVKTFRKCFIAGRLPLLTSPASRASVKCAMTPTLTLATTLALATLAVSGCSSSGPPPPVPVEGAPADLKALKGEWEGEDRGAETGRDGLLTGR